MINEATEMDLQSLIIKIRDAGYTGIKWRFNKLTLIDGEGEWTKDDVVGPEHDFFESIWDALWECSPFEMTLI